MANDIKKRIEKFIKKYPEPQQYPIILHWERKDGYHEQQYFQTNGVRSWKYKVGSKVIMSQFKYDEKLELCELSYAEFPHNTPKPNEKRRWHYVYRYFIPKGERVLYNADGTTGHYRYVRASYECWTNWADEFARHFAGMHGWGNQQFKEEFLKFCGTDIKCKSHWNGDTISNVYHLPEWFKYVPKTRTTGKVQQTIDKLVAMGVDDIDEFMEQKMKDVIRKHTSSWRSPNVAYFDVAHKVLRCFTGLENGELQEDKRVYIDGKKPIIATFDNNEGWITNGSFTNRQFRHEIVNYNDVCDMQYCGYLTSLFGQESNPTVYRVVSIMRQPEIEQLINMNLTTIAKLFVGNSAHGSLKTEIENAFGKPTKAKNVCQKYQMTKKQLDHIDKIVAEKTGNQNYYYSSDLNIVSRLKQIFGDNLSSLDIDTFKRVCDVVKDMDSWRFRSLIDNCPEKQDVLRIINMADRHRDAVTVYVDACDEYNRISYANKPAIRPRDCRSYEEIVRCHDACVRIHNMEREEQQRLWNMGKAERDRKLEEKRVKLDKERIKMNYEDDEFIIRLPETLVEIVNEGSVLGHCVGGYTQNHAQGNCTIMFLRKKSDPDTSFYTIEVTPSNTIQQIHGRHNKWLGNNPEAIPTVVRWLRKNNITCSNEILTCKSVGYGKTNEYVAMPQVD